MAPTVSRIGTDTVALDCASAPFAINARSIAHTGAVRKASDFDRVLVGMDIDQKSSSRFPSFSSPAAPGLGIVERDTAQFRRA